MSTEIEDSVLEMIDAELRQRDDLQMIDAEMQRRGSFVDGIIEPARTIASAINRNIRGGYRGMAEQAMGGDGAAVVRQEQEQIYQPQTEAGQRNLERLGDLAQFGIDVVNFPVSGIGGLIELLTGQGVDQAANTVRNVQDNGAGVTFGDRVFEETGNPLMATGARIFPEATAELIGLKGAGRGARTASNNMPAVIEQTQQFFLRQSPAKQRIAMQLLEGSTDNSLAPWRLEPPRNGTGGQSGRRNQLPRVVPDRLAEEATRQGFDPGVLMGMKQGSQADRAKMLQMVEISQRGRQNRLFAQENRPTDVVGNSVAERYNFVLNKNREAGQQLDQVAQSLRGQQFDADPVTGQFLADLESIGVRLDDNLQPVFRGSDIEGITGAEQAVRRIVQRMASPNGIDAYEAHRLKRYIDENVTYGATQEGLTGRTETILKRLRHNLDEQLDGSFDEYRQVNEQYADTINALDGLQDVAGRKMDLTGPNADKAIGTLTRRLMSNAQSRIPLYDSLGELESIGRKYGAEFDDNLMLQALFADELDSVFGPVARTSLQGQVDQGVRQAMRNPRDAIIDRALETVVERVSNVNEDAAFSAIRDFINQGGIR